jgi:hypothetical protein
MIGVLAAGLACGPDGETDSGGGSESSETGASTGGGTTMGESATTMPMMTGGATGDTTSADSTGVPPGDTSAEGTTGTPDTDGTEGTTGGEPTGPAYPPCAPDQDPVCPEPYEQCVELGGGPGGGGNAEGMWCTIPCEDAAECPVPDSGTAEVICGGPPMQPTRCELDCSMGECPDGMDCVGLGPMGQVMRCAWPPA